MSPPAQKRKKEKKGVKVGRRGAGSCCSPRKSQKRKRGCGVSPPAPAPRRKKESKKKRASERDVVRGVSPDPAKKKWVRGLPTKEK